AVTASLVGAAKSAPRRLLNEDYDVRALRALGPAPDARRRGDRVLPRARRDGVLDAARRSDVAAAGRKRRLQRVRKPVVPLHDVTGNVGAVGELARGPGDRDVVAGHRPGGGGTTSRRRNRRTLRYLRPQPRLAFPTRTLNETIRMRKPRLLHTTSGSGLRAPG